MEASNVVRSGNFILPKLRWEFIFRRFVLPKLRWEFYILFRRFVPPKLRWEFLFGRSSLAEGGEKIENALGKGYRWEFLFGRSNPS
jgi:hypothetical protein